MSNYLTSFSKTGDESHFDLNTTPITNNASYRNNNLTTTFQLSPTYNSFINSQILSFSSETEKTIQLSSIRAMVSSLCTTPSNDSKCFIVKYNGLDSNLFEYLGYLDNDSGGYGPSSTLLAYYESVVKNTTTPANFTVMGSMDYTNRYDKTTTFGSPTNISTLLFSTNTPIELTSTNIPIVYLVMYVLKATILNPYFAMYYSDNNLHDHKNGVLFDDIVVNEYRIFDGRKTTGTHGYYYSIAGGFGDELNLLLTANTVMFIALYGDVIDTNPLCFTGDSICLTKNGNKKVCDIKNGDYVYSSDIGDYVKIEKIYTSETKDGVVVIPKHCLNETTPFLDLKITSDHMIKYNKNIMQAKQLNNIYELNTDQPIKIYTFVTYNGCYVDVNGMSVKTFSKYERLIIFL